ncbi:MAG: MXAN_2562 family outer membrane beta-barrel protein [Myxococcota bacterium]
MALMSGTGSAAAHDDEGRAHDHGAGDGTGASSTSNPRGGAYVVSGEAAGEADRARTGATTASAAADASGDDATDDDDVTPKLPPARAIERQGITGGRLETSGEDLYERPSNLPREDWRRSQRSQIDDEDAWFDASRFYFELRFGTYSPQIDDDPNLGEENVYERFFGGGLLFHFGLELDWVPVYIPWVGSLGPGVGFGFSEASGRTFAEDGSGDQAESETTLAIYPFHASLVFRFDGLLREASVPVVPYGKLGFGWALWEIDGPSGTARVGDVEGRGTSYGLHYALGAAIALNGFDPTAAIHMREETGISYAYLFAEWFNQDLGNLGPSDQLLVGSSSAVFGLALGI